MASELKLLITQLESNDITPFLYLKNANELLSNHAQEEQGRELIIRALAEPKKFKSSEKILKDLVRKSGLFPYLNSKFKKHTIEEDFVLDIYKSNYSDDFIFHSMQLKILETVEVKVEGGTVAGTRIRIRNHGMGKLQRRGRGDLYAEVDIHVPTKVKRKEKELLNKLSESSSFKLKKS